MTTVQESRNGHHHLFPPPFSVENAVELNRAHIPTDKTNNNQPTTSADDPIGERQKGVPITPLLAHKEVLPDRCQFTFSDGRQCTMARSDIHPSLCRFHAEREYQLFGEPSPAGYVVGRALDLPELYSACRDLTTATSVNRVLAQVFRLLAQRRISRQEAATFGHLAQLLLRTISLIRQENLTIPLSSGESHLSAANVYPSSRESHGHQELSRANKDEFRGADQVQELSPLNKVPATADPARSSSEIPAACDSPSIPRTPFPAPTKEPFSAPNHPAHNSRRINTSENADVKTVQNEHLRKNGGGAGAPDNENSGETQSSLGNSGLKNSLNSIREG